MIFIAESGSTKCDAVFINENGTEHSRVQINGLNPQHLSSEQIRLELQANQEIVNLGDKVSLVHFYGAGCSSPDANAIVEKALKTVFPNAEITVQEDLLAVAHATYSGGPAICCILGTGSNCFYFDGKKAHKGMAGLGYILGDEGSAGDLGIQIVLDFLHKRLPAEIYTEFKETYNLDRDEIIRRVYRTPGANTFLAGFATFVGEHITHPYFQRMVKKSFSNFTELYILPFQESREVPIHFAGSVAYHSKALLEEVLKEHGLNLGSVIKRPIDGLVKYHGRKIQKSKSRHQSQNKA